MILPYKFRVMAALPGHQPIELTRSKRRIECYDLSAWAKGMSARWKVWVEKPLLDRETITARPGSRRWHTGRIAVKGEVQA